MHWQSYKKSKLNRFKLSISFLAFLSISAYSYAESGSYFQKAERLFAKRDKNAKGINADPDIITKAIELYEAAYEHGEHAEKAGAKLLHAYYFKGCFVDDSREQKKITYAKGKKLAEELNVKYPENPDIKFWYFVNLGKWAEIYGKIRAVQEGVADKLKIIAEGLIEIDPDYQYGAGYRLLGILHIEVPYIPLVMTWPDNEEGLIYLEKAYNMNPNLIDNARYYGEALLVNGYEEKGKNILRKALSLQPDVHHVIEEKYMQVRAQEVLNEYN